MQTLRNKDSSTQAQTPGHRHTDTDAATQKKDTTALACHRLEEHGRAVETRAKQERTMQKQVNTQGRVADGATEAQPHRQRHNQRHTDRERHRQRVRDGYR